MKHMYFLKLNVVSMVYAFLIFVPIELMANVYRISRLTNWQIDTVHIVTLLVILIEVIAGTMILFYLSKKWLDGRKANFWTAILWLPYFLLMMYVFASLFPITNGGDVPNPVTGLFIIGGLIVYPVYIVIINIIGVKKDILQAN
ncbi:hypothetical protein F9U64_21035 [Gracilibacillus oryzae]|uniref:DUF2569 family protein n=2 Tax=Gracilibacillus oryzae TaxID=1672701 RepID=A0A7C8GQD8_9BACI|nr:hypothetical protein F9U64_21035 [Gracilibacillus oryzae]